MTLAMTSIRKPLPLPLLVFLLACPTEDDDNTDTAANTATSSNSPDSDPGSGDDTSSSGAPDLEVDPEAAAACSVFCASVDACGDSETCSDDEFCELTAGLISQAGDSCIGAYQAWVECIEQTPCEDWAGDVEDIPACAEPLGSYAETCLL